jgi:hypothetical protein
LTLLEQGRRTADAELISQAAALFRQTGANTYLVLAQQVLTPAAAEPMPHFAQRHA